LIEALFDDVRRPLINFVVSVGVATDGALDSLLDDVADLVDDESGLLGSVEIIHDCSLTILTTTAMVASGQQFSSERAESVYSNSDD